MTQAHSEPPPASSRSSLGIGFSFQEDLWFGDFDDEAAREAAASSMAAMAGKVMGARPFPAAAQRLVQLTRNPDSNIHKVVRVLESDPGLSQRVLRLVNSAGYGLRVRCTSLNHATALLGQNRLQQIATSAVLLNHFGRTSEETKRKQEHGALVASLCRYLAIHLGLPQEDLFTCGLLHDLGQLMMLDDGDKEYVALVNAHQDEWDALHISEREILGFDHAVLAAHVLASWSIPAPVPEVIALHHQPALAHQAGAKISAMVQTLRFADHMSHLLDGTSPMEGSKELADSEAASYLGFSEMQIGAMWKDLQQLRDANRSRRMDIADIAPRSVEVPASLAPRATAITDAPMPMSGAPSHPPTAPAPTYSDPPGVGESLPPDSLPLSGGLRPLHDDNVIRLEHATPTAQAESLRAAAEESERQLYGSPDPGSQVRVGQHFPDENEDLDDRASDLSAAPEVFPCAICYGPTFGARCPVCSAHVCSAHQTNGRQWCVACDDEYGRFLGEHTINRVVKIATVTGIAVAFFSTGLLLGWGPGFGILGIAMATSLAAYAAYQGYLKAQFKKDRSPTEAAPPTLCTPHTHRDTLAGLRLSEKEQIDVAREMESIPPAQQKPRASRSTKSAAPFELEPTDSELASKAPTLEQSLAQAAMAPDIHMDPRISAHPIEKQTLNLGSIPPQSDIDSEREQRMAQQTIPVPSVARARERSSMNADEAPSSRMSWPPSQEPPGASQRTSFLPQAGTDEDAIRDHFSDSSANETQTQHSDLTPSGGEPQTPEAAQPVASQPVAAESEATQPVEQHYPEHEETIRDEAPIEQEAQRSAQAIAPPRMSDDEPAPQEQEATNEPAPQEQTAHDVENSTEPEAQQTFSDESAQTDASSELDAPGEREEEASPAQAAPPQDTGEPQEAEQAALPTQQDEEASPETHETSEPLLSEQTAANDVAPEYNAVPPSVTMDAPEPNISFAAPLCEPARVSASITPPVIRRNSEFCTAPSGTVKILPIQLAPGAAPPPSNNQSERNVSGDR